eukprot:Gb_40474 [translate_table: standard]
MDEEVATSPMAIWGNSFFDSSLSVPLTNGSHWTKVTSSGTTASLGSYLETMGLGFPRVGVESWGPSLRLVLVLPTTALGCLSLLTKKTYRGEVGRRSSSSLFFFQVGKEKGQCLEVTLVLTLSLEDFSPSGKAICPRPMAVNRWMVGWQEALSPSPLLKFQESLMYLGRALLILLLPTFVEWTLTKDIGFECLEEDFRPGQPIRFLSEGCHILCPVMILGNSALDHVDMRSGLDRLIIFRNTDQRSISLIVVFYPPELPPVLLDIFGEYVTRVYTII